MDARVNTRNKPAETKHRKGLWVCLNGGIFVRLILAISAAITQYLASVFGYADFLSGRIAGKLFLPWNWGIYPALMQRVVLLFVGSSAVTLVLCAVELMQRSWLKPREPVQNGYSVMGLNPIKVRNTT